MDSNVVKDALLESLDNELADIAAVPWQAGLFVNDLDDDERDHTISDITPASTGGYEGLKDLDDWGAAVWDDPYAVAEHADVVWTFDGSATVTVRGVYVVDGSGDLRWWRKFPGVGITVGFFAGQTFTAFPVRRRSSLP